MTRRSATTLLAAGVALAADKPLACNPNALTAEQRKEHSGRSKRLYGALREPKELPDGWQFTLNLASMSLEETARWIDLERLCCPFLRFTLEVAPESRTVTLRLAGPEGVKEFLRSQFRQ